VFYRARVEDRIDPLGLGRVRVRIPALHDGVDPSNLPWAYMVSPLGGGSDSGSFCVPEVGSFVLVTPECDPPCRTFLYFGVIRGTGIDDQRGSFTGSEKDLMGKWMSGGREEVPVEGSCKDEDPSNYVVSKSLKGATIVMRDKNGEESVEIISQSGSIIGMKNPRKDNHKGLKDTRRESTSDDFIGQSAYMKTGDTTVICTEEGVVEISNGSSMIKVNGAEIVMSNGSASISIGSSGISLNGGTINLNGSLNLGVSTSNPVGSESSIPTDLKG
jgi:hypothetical protein